MKNSVKSNLLLCDSNNSTLVIIDVQERLTEAMPAKVLFRLKKNITLLIKAADSLSIPIFATEQYPKGLGSMEQEIVEILPSNALRFEKTCFSCVGADNFLEKLKSSGKKQIILLGLEAHVCVLQTAIDLLVNDYQVFVVIDGICSRHRENYEASLLRMRQSGIITCIAESVLFEWLRDSKNEHFKMLSELVR